MFLFIAASTSLPLWGVWRFLDTCLGGHDCTKGDDNGNHDVDNATENLSCLWFHFFKFLSKFLFLFLVFVRSSVFVFCFRLCSDVVTFRSRLRRFVVPTGRFVGGYASVL